MPKDLFKNYIFPIVTFAGGIIGVGFLSLPYVTARVGIFAMVFYFIVLTGLVVIIHVIFAQICLQTPDFKRWPGFVGFYLGPWAKRIVLISMTFGIFCVMLVYLIVGSQFLTAALNPFFGGSVMLYAIFYFFSASALIFLGIKVISRVDFLSLFLLVVTLCIVIVRGFSHMQLGNIFISPSTFNFSNAFLPYGALLFSLWGVGFIPEIEEMVPAKKASLRNIIISSTVLVAIFYFLFTLVMLSITGSRTTESALVGLGVFWGRGMMLVVLAMGIISTFMAFIAQGLLLKKMFIYDVGIKEFPAWVFTCFPPFILFYLGFNSFIPLISFIGGVLLSIDGILILLMYRKIGGKKIIIYPLVAVFVLGIVYSVAYFVK